MREIEFRAKRLDNNQWVYGFYSPRIWYPSNEQTPNVKELTGSDVLIKPETLGQYTGRKDKNGKKIFDGDFIKARHNDELYRVYWESYRFIIEDNYGNVILPVQEAIDHFECEVVGNIYDNPKLLKGE